MLGLKVSWLSLACRLSARSSSCSTRQINRSFGMLTGSACEASCQSKGRFACTRFTIADRLAQLRLSDHVAEVRTKARWRRARPPSYSSSMVGALRRRAFAVICGRNPSPAAFLGRTCDNKEIINIFFRSQACKITFAINTLPEMPGTGRARVLQACKPCPTIEYCTQHAGARWNVEKLKGAYQRVWLLIARLLLVHLHGLQHLGSRSFLIRATGSACNLV